MVSGSCQSFKKRDSKDEEVGKSVKGHREDEQGKALEPMRPCVLVQEGSFTLGNLSWRGRGSPRIEVNGQ